MITVDLKQQKIFADGAEITGISEFVLGYAPGHKRLTASRFKIDEYGKPMAEFGAIFEQDLNFSDDQFEVITTPFLAGDNELSLRYENKQQQDIKHNAPKKFELKAKFVSPMEILNYLGDTDIQIYLLMKGLEWSGSGIDKVNEEIAGNLRQEYLEMGEADAGEKYEAFQSILADALSLNVIGASGKKLRERGEKEMAKPQKEKVEELARIYEAQGLAKERLAARKTALSEPQSDS
jgi:hypothetical protein